MVVSVIEFCTPPIPGQSHEFYGNAHNNFIKLPLAPALPLIDTTITTKPVTQTLHSIAASGNLSLFNNVLSVSPNPHKAVNEPHPINGLTPLHLASSRGHFDIVQCLIDQYSAIVDIRDKEGETALLKAAYNGHFIIVKYLISKKSNIHLKDKDGWTALHNACARGYLSISKMLIESGAHVDVKSKMGHTPLINAASKGYISIVEYLLDKAHANPLIKNNFGEAAYDVSAAAGESYICNMLYKSGLSWWRMQFASTEDTDYSLNNYNVLDFHVTVMVAVHENERSSSLLGFSKPQFSAGSLTKYDTRGHWSLVSTGEPCLIDQVELPPNERRDGTDWFWLTDWQLDFSDPTVDPISGWQYAKSFHDLDWTPVAPMSGYGWVRRRQWVRVMKRRMDLAKGSHVGTTLTQEDDYLSEVEDNVQKSKRDPTEEPSVQQLTTELRTLEESVQLLRARIKKDGNQYRIHQANILITNYTSQIDTLNSQILQLGHTLTTPITPQPLQHNPELARELNFINQVTEDQIKPKHTEGDLDSNPWSRDGSTTPTSHWQTESILETSSFNAVSLVGHGMESDRDEEEEQAKVTAKEYVWESDADVKECRGCRKRFGFLIRRHHCRCCGLIHCDRCSTSRAYLDPSQILQDPNGPLESLELLSSNHQRVCDTCYAKLGGVPS